MKDKLISIVIRTLNEERYLEELLLKISEQTISNFEVEVVIVDSGSSDSTLEIANKYQCRITHISKSDFTFGRSLNIGCEYADGSFLVFVSGHCIPASNTWLLELVLPLNSGQVVYTYGKQIGRDGTKFSERQLFKKYFPDDSSLPQDGYFCNNANSAIRKDVWKKYKFDEQLTGCEDMYLAKELVKHEMKLGYVATAPVYHIHDESWREIKNRYEREAIALQKIMPEVHLNFLDMTKYIFIGTLIDFKSAWKENVFISECLSICAFRYVQYVGAYKGNHMHRKLSKEMKMKYFYPRVSSNED